MQLPIQFLVSVFCKAGSWKSGGATVCAWSVCRDWRDALRGSTFHLAALLVEVHGAKRALVRAAGSTSAVVDRCALLRQLLLSVRADCLGGQALIAAAKLGHEDVVQLLLEQADQAPSSTCQEVALQQAVSAGHTAVVQLLLQRRRRYGPCADSLGGYVLVAAAHKGDKDMVQLLLQWPHHAPSADCMAGSALAVAACLGHVAVVQLLLSHWPRHAAAALAGAIRQCDGSSKPDVLQLLQAALVQIEAQ